MTKMADDAAAYGKEFIDTGLQSFSQVAKSAQAIATEATDYTKASYESATALIEKLFSAKSLDNAIQLQSDYAKSAYEGFVAEASKISELYADMAKEAYKPFESIVAKAK